MNLMNNKKISNIIVIFLLIFTSFLGGCVPYKEKGDSQQEIDLALKNANELIEAIEKYKNKNGEYPDKIKDLIENNFIKKYPKINKDRYIYYKKINNNYKLYFRIYKDYWDVIIIANPDQGYGMSKPIYI